MVKEALKAIFCKTESTHVPQSGNVYRRDRNSHYGHAVTVYLHLAGDKAQGSYNIIITAILLITLLFANFAEAIAEARGKAQADSLRKTREDTPAKKVFIIGDMYVNEIKIVPSSQLKKAMYLFVKQEILFQWTEKLLKVLPPLMKVLSLVNLLR